MKQPPTWLKIILVIITMVLIILVFVSIFSEKTPMHECKDLCAGEGASSYERLSCASYCQQIKFYGGEEALIKEVEAMKQNRSA